MSEKHQITKNIPLLLTFFGSVGFILLCVYFRISPDRLIGAAFCHQVPSRSPSAGFPFCYRCCGLFCGIFASILYNFLAARDPKLFSWQTFIFFAASFCLFLLDVANKSKFIDIDLYPETPYIRFVSAYPMGFFLASIIMPVFEHFFEIKHPQMQINGAAKLFLFIFGLVLCYALCFQMTSFGLIIVRALTVSGSFLFIFILYSLLIKCLAQLMDIKCRNQSAYLSGLFLAILQICLLGGIHVILVHLDLWLL